MTKRLNLMMLVIAMVLGLLTTLVIVKKLQSIKQHEDLGPGLSVVVVVKTVAPRQLIDSSDVALKSVPVAAVEPGAETSLQSVIGHYASTHWFAGQQVVSPMVVTTSSQSAFPLSIPMGSRAFTLADDAVTGVDHLISKGDHVDILASFNSKGQNISKTILQDVLVLHVDQAPVTESASSTRTTLSNASSNASSQSSNKFDTLTLAVLPSQADVLEYASAFGQLRVILRGPSDPLTSSVADVNSINQLP